MVDQSDNNVHFPLSKAMCIRELFASCVCVCVYERDRVVHLIFEKLCCQWFSHHSNDYFVMFLLKRDRIFFLSSFFLLVIWILMFAIDVTRMLSIQRFILTYMAHGQSLCENSYPIRTLKAFHEQGSQNSLGITARMGWKKIVQLTLAMLEKSKIHL